MYNKCVCDIYNYSVSLFYNPVVIVVNNTRKAKKKL